MHRIRKLHEAVEDLAAALDALAPGAGSDLVIELPRTTVDRLYSAFELLSPELLEGPRHHRGDFAASGIRFKVTVK